MPRPDPVDASSGSRRSGRSRANGAFCDDVADELVLRDFSAMTDTDAFEVEHRLERARLDVASTIEGTEVRQAGCDDLAGPDGRAEAHHDPDDEVTHLGQFPVRVSVSWDGHEALQRTHSQFTWDAPDHTVRSDHQTTFREADAVGSLHGLNEFGVDAELGASTVAEIASFHNSEIVIGGEREPLPGEG